MTLQFGRIGHRDALQFNTLLLALTMAMIVAVLMLYRVCWSGMGAKKVSAEFAPLLRGEM